jgi:oligoribonuclease
MKHFFWVDLEMTGLDESKDSILEVAAVVTDLELTPVREFHRVVYQPASVLEGMNDWCKKTHGESGLTAAVPTGTPLATVEKELLTLVDEFFPAKERVVLCGNSVGNDKRFIDRHLPLFAKRLHYRLIDVSSFKEIFREKYRVGFQKANAHRAVDDIHESIRELKHYLGFVKVPGVEARSEAKE